MVRAEVRFSQQHFSAIPSPTPTKLTDHIDGLAGHDRRTLPGRFVAASVQSASSSYLLAVLLELRVVIAVEARVSRRGVSELRSGPYYL